MPLADILNRGSWDVAAPGRVMSFPGQDVGNSRIIEALTRQFEDAGLHLGPAAESVQGMHSWLDGKL